MVHSEKTIQKLLIKNNGRSLPNYSFMIPNCYTNFDNECDMFAVRGSGFYDEFEIKISKADFKNDAKKTVYKDWCSKTKQSIYEAKYKCLENGSLGNYFWYVVPENLISLDEVPKFAGLIYVSNNKLKIIRSPKRLHKNKLSETQINKYLSKVYYRWLKFYESL